MIIAKLLKGLPVLMETECTWSCWQKPVTKPILSQMIEPTTYLISSSSLSLRLPN